MESTREYRVEAIGAGGCNGVVSPNSKAAAGGEAFSGLKGRCVELTCASR